MILKTLLDENRQRGGVATGLTLGFDTAKDSADSNWAKKYTLYYSLGTDLQTILSALVNGGGCDWRTSGRTLKMWNADSAALSRDLSKQVVLQLARDISEAPFEESIADLASTILVEGDNDLLFRMDNPAAPTPWGKWESYSSQGGVSDKDTAQAFMQSTLDDAARVRGQYTRDLVTSGVDNLPLIDYHAGDWITAPTVAHGEKVRVREIDLSMRQNEGLSASIALNDIKYDASMRQAKKIKGITGGAALAGSESGTTASSDHDHRVPKAPQGLVVQTDDYIGSDGYAHGLATAMWSAVSEATNDTAIEISNYALEWRKHVDGAPWHSAGTTDKLQLGFGGLDCGTQIEVRVRAVPTYSDQLGEWSSVFVATVESDVTPCSVPSKPVLSSELGVVTIHWDGKTSAGASMESDFDHVEVGEGINAAGMRVISATQSGQGDYLVTGLPAGSEHTYALRSVDHAGNRSAWSVTASVTVASAVSPEEVKQIQADLAANTETLKDSGAKLEQAQKDITANRTAQAETAKQLDSAKSDITANQTAIDAANKTLTAETVKLSQARKDIVQARSDITSITGDVERAKADILANTDRTATAQRTADGKNLIYRGPDEPAHDGLKPGDMWWRTQAYRTRWQGKANASPSDLADFYTYWQGEANNSPSVLVPLADRVIEVLTWDGTRFEPFDLVANNILAAGSVVAKHLASDSVTTAKLKADSVTADKLTANSVTTDKLVADAVTAAKLAANSVQARNIVSLAITTDKIAANSVTTGKLKVTEDMTVALLNVHKIQAGDISANAVTTSALAAGAVNADKLAANSVNASKIVSNAITADKLAANSVTAVKIAAGTITSDKVAAGQFRGYVFTGAIFQSSEAENTGMKLNSNALQMWDSNHNRTVYLDGQGGSNVITGRLKTGISGRYLDLDPAFNLSSATGYSSQGAGVRFVGDGFTGTGNYPFVSSELVTGAGKQVSGLTASSGLRVTGRPNATLTLLQDESQNGVAQLTAFSDITDSKANKAMVYLAETMAGGGTARLQSGSAALEFTDSNAKLNASSLAVNGKPGQTERINLIVGMSQSGNTVTWTTAYFDTQLGIIVTAPSGSQQQSMTFVSEDKYNALAGRVDNLDNLNGISNSADDESLQWQGHIQSQASPVNGAWSSYFVEKSLDGSVRSRTGKFKVQLNVKKINTGYGIAATDVSIDFTTKRREHSGGDGITNAGSTGRMIQIMSGLVGSQTKAVATVGSNPTTVSLKEGTEYFVNVSYRTQSSGDKGMYTDFDLSVTVVPVSE